MPIAAVPAYLGNDFKDASPGLRFSVLLPIWTTRLDQEADVRKRAEARSREGEEVASLLERDGMEKTIHHLRARPSKPLPGLWDKNEFAAKQAWSQVKSITGADRKRAEALITRLSAVAASTQPSQLLRLDAKALAPFTTGLGNAHPLENGFAFLNPYGLPYLPGSGVKGVLRRAAQELACGDWGDTAGWSQDPVCTIAIDKKTVALSVIDVLFGREPAAGASEHVRGVLGFWDVIPQIAGDSLLVEIMTPHQSHYYQQKRDRKAGDSTSPHDSGQPNPISFLTVPPGSGFTFHVVCDEARLKQLAPALLEVQDGLPRWKRLMAAAFEHAFQWLGFGAKTAVGYGAMQRDAAAETKAAHAAAQARAAAEREARLAALTPNLRRVEEFKTAMQKRWTELKDLKGGKDKPNTGAHQLAQQLARDAAGDGWSAEEKRAAADAIAEWLPQVVQVDMKEERKKLRLAALRGDA